MDPKKIAAVIVTKGDVDLDPLLDSLSIFGELLIWDNGFQRRDRRVFGRYIAAGLSGLDYVYVQDDDCLIDTGRLCSLYRPGELLCNVKTHHGRVYAAEYPGITLVGWGAIFPKTMIDFSSYLAKHPEDELFDRECDRVFTWLNRDKTRTVDIGVTDLPHATGPDRMGTEARHGGDLAEIRRRLGTL